MGTLIRHRPARYLAARRVALLSPALASQYVRLADVAPGPENATLNGISFGFEVAGLALIRRRRITAHRNCMLGDGRLGAVPTLWRALRNQIDRHRRIARWTAPIWLYVSVTGVFVYVMLYRLFPAQS